MTKVEPLILVLNLIEFTIDHARKFVRRNKAGKTSYLLVKFLFYLREVL